MSNPGGGGGEDTLDFNYRTKAVDNMINMIKVGYSMAIEPELPSIMSIESRVQHPSTVEPECLRLLDTLIFIVG